MTLIADAPFNLLQIMTNGKTLTAMIDDARHRGEEHAWRQSRFGGHPFTPTTVAASLNQKVQSKLKIKLLDLFDLFVLQADFMLRSIT